MLKDNKYLSNLYSACIGTEIDNGTRMLLLSWKKCEDCENLIVKSRFDKLGYDELGLFVFHLRNAGIRKFDIEANTISIDALHHFIYCIGQYTVEARQEGGSNYFRITI